MVAAAGAVEARVRVLWTGKAAAVEAVAVVDAIISISYIFYSLGC